MELQLAPVERIIRKVGKKKDVDRVARDAVEKLAVYLEEIGLEIAEDAVRIAAHSGRSTIKAEDIRLAMP